MLGNLALNKSSERMRHSSYISSALLNQLTKTGFSCAIQFPFRVKPAQK